LVDGAKNFALRIGITPFVVGLTIIAFGSSAPEVFTSIVSVDNPEIIIGNIVGSNIVNIGLAIGMAAMLVPIACVYRSIRFELISMLAAVSLVALLSLNGYLSFFDGVLLTSLIFVFVALVYYVKKKKRKDVVPDVPALPKKEDVPERDPKLSVSIAKMAAGLIMVFVGATFFVDGAVELTFMFGVSELLVGLLVVAVGTSLPEFCICLVAARKGENELVISNIVGSVIFNSFFALGVGALLVSVPINESLLVFHIPVMILMCAVLFLMIRTRNAVSRPMGVLLVTMYVSYVLMIIANPSLAV
jgi:cation:H+ antiporter